MLATTAPPTSAPPARPSPAPGNVPNGKPASPFTDQKSPPPSAASQPASSAHKDPKAAATAAADPRNVVRRKLTGYVGFANLPNQWHRKSVRKGFNFNVMVVGRFHTVTRFRPALTYIIQVNLDSENQPWSIPSSIPLSTLQKSARGRALTSFPRPSLFSQSALISRKMACVCA